MKEQSLIYVFLQQKMTEMKVKENGNVSIRQTEWNHFKRKTSKQIRKFSVIIAYARIREKQSSWKRNKFGERNELLKTSFLLSVFAKFARSESKLKCELGQRIYEERDRERKWKERKYERNAN